MQSSLSIILSRNSLKGECGGNFGTYRNQLRLRRCRSGRHHRTGTPARRTEWNSRTERSLLRIRFARSSTGQIQGLNEKEKQEEKSETKILKR